MKEKTTSNEIAIKVYIKPMSLFIESENNRYLDTMRNPESRESYSQCINNFLLKIEQKRMPSRTV